MKDSNLFLVQDKFLFQIAAKRFQLINLLCLAINLELINVKQTSKDEKWQKSASVTQNSSICNAPAKRTKLSIPQYSDSTVESSHLAVLDEKKMFSQGRYLPSTNNHPNPNACHSPALFCKLHSTLLTFS